MGDTALKGSTIATSYDWLVFRGDTFSATGNRINLMNDSGVVQPSSLYLDTTNSNVGIGTASPDRTLHIAKAGAAGVFLRLENTDDIGSGEVVGIIEFDTQNSTNAGVGASILVDTADGNGSMDMSFHTGTAAQTYERLTILSNGNVGIGAATPTSPLSVEANIADQGIMAHFYDTTMVNGDDCRIQFGADGSAHDSGVIKFNRTGTTSDTNNYISFGLVTTEDTLTVVSTQRVGIGTTAPAQLLDLKSVTSDTLAATGAQNLSFSMNGGSNLFGYQLDTDGDLHLIGQDSSTWYDFWIYNRDTREVSGDVIDTSDISLKKNIEDSNIGLSVINQLRSRSFQWKAGGRGTRIGFIAQEVKKVLPEASAGEDGSMGVKTNAIVSVLVKAVQELSAKVEALENA